MRKGILAAVLVLAPLALAQAPTLAPTRGDGPDAYAKGENSAAVNQTIELILPKATALHLDVTTLTSRGWTGRSGPTPTRTLAGRWSVSTGLETRT